MKGHCVNFGAAGAQIKVPGCSLRMGIGMGIVNKDAAAIYKHLNFNQIEEYV